YEERAARRLTEQQSLALCAVERYPRPDATREAALGKCHRQPALGEVVRAREHATAHGLADDGLSLPDRIRLERWKRPGGGDAPKLCQFGARKRGSVGADERDRVALPHETDPGGAGWIGK